MSNPPLPTLGIDGHILEGIVTTENLDGTLNIAPMGPLVGQSLETLVLRPFRTSTTYGNLLRTRLGVLHISDDVELFAQAAMGSVTPVPDTLPQEPLVLADTCRWVKFEIVSIDDSEDRACLVGQAVSAGNVREFLGFNRAKHAVIEAAILATRVHLLSSEKIQTEFAALKVLVDKTGSAAEHRAFNLLESYVSEQVASTSCCQELAT